MSAQVKIVLTFTTNDQTFVLTFTTNGQTFVLTFTKMVRYWYNCGIVLDNTKNVQVSRLLLHI